MKKPEYFLYYVDEYGQKKYYIGDGKFVTCLASECGCTKFDQYEDAAKVWEELSFRLERDKRILLDFH